MYGARKRKSYYVRSFCNVVKGFATCDHMHKGYPGDFHCPLAVWMGDGILFQCTTICLDMVLVMVVASFWWKQKSPCNLKLFVFISCSIAISTKIIELGRAGCKQEWVTCAHGYDTFPFVIALFTFGSTAIQKHLRFVFFFFLSV